MKARDIIYPVLLLIFAGIIVYFYLRPVETKVVIETRENVEKIDSLNYLIRDKNRIIDSLKKEKSKIHQKIVVKVKELQTLPADQTIEVFHNNTEKYGECNSEIPILMEDSTIKCTPENLIDANIIAAKYEGALEEKLILEKIIEKDSAIINEKDLIIQENSIILHKTEAAYSKSIENLQASLKKEKIRRKAVIGTTGGIIALILGYLVIK